MCVCVYELLKSLFESVLICHEFTSFSQFCYHKPRGDVSFKGKSHVKMKLFLRILCALILGLIIFGLTRSSFDFHGKEVWYPLDNSKLGGGDVSQWTRPLCVHGLILLYNVSNMHALISNYVKLFMWDEITYPCHNFNGGLHETFKWSAVYVTLTHGWAIHPTV